MGYLNDQGVTYDFFESLMFQKHMKEKGINQFLNLLECFGNFNVHDYEYDSLNDPTIQGKSKFKLLWGDEFEGHVLKLFPEQKLALLQPNTGRIFDEIQKYQEYLPLITLPEFGAWMIEMTPNKPYQCMCFNFDQVVINMRRRIQTLEQFLPPANKYLLIPVYPMLGVGRFTTTVESDLNAMMVEKIKASIGFIENSPTLTQDESTTIEQFPKPKTQAITPLKDLNYQNIWNYFSLSDTFDDRLINPHPRYCTLAQNIRLRRGSNVEIKIPLYKDTNTIIKQGDNQPNPGFITMDHMGYGMGNCALQTTYLSIDMNHARLLYDQLAILAPLFAALTAGSPAFNGKLADWDTKWDCLEMSVDCRTQEERNENHPKYIPKSRYSSISSYISNDPMNLPQYNDVKFPMNEQIMEYAKLKSSEMGLKLDQRLLNHLGILFLRDNMVMFKDKLLISDDDTTAHFEAIQSTNWNSVRFKPPPSYSSKIGWRVEFRTMEIQLTPEENAAWSIYILMIVRLFFTRLVKINFYIPISMVDANMRRSRERDAILTQKFYFRTNIQDEGEPQIEELYLKEILFGNGKFKGIQGLLDECKQLMMKDGCPQEQKEIMDKNKKLQFEVIDFVKQRVFGETKTLANWIRTFFINHPLYKQDSIINHTMNYDLIARLIEIKEQKVVDPNFPRIFSI